MSIKTKLLLCNAVFVLAIVNFAAYWLAAVYLGGDAINGRSGDGHYFLMSHGKYTEVSEAVFTYSRYHTYSLWLTHPLAFIAAFVAQSLKGASAGGDATPEP